MEQRVDLNEMSVPEKSEKSKDQDNGEPTEDSGEQEEKDKSLPALGRLSLNVKAVPYIPKQDGAAFVPKGDDSAGIKTKDETREETGANLTEFDSKEQHGGSTESQKFLTENHFGDETEEELRAQVVVLKQTLKHYEEMIGQFQASEQTRKREVDSALISAREVVERERREKLDVLSDQKSRQEQFEQLSKALNMLKTENDELVKHRRQQDEKLTELTRLKTLIQENGFPNIEQFLMLQQQIDSFRDDFFTERKERERLQSQKDKMKRELDVSQSRIASLQEQVYKYREHIYYIQNKFKPSSPFRPLPFHDSGNSRQLSASEACKLYGPNATQYINQGLTPAISPSPTGDPKFQSRNEKKAFTGRFSEGGGRQWQDSRLPHPMTGDDDWRRQQQQQQQQTNRNGYFPNRLTTSNSSPSLVAMASGEQSSDMTFYDKQYPKPGYQRRAKSSLTEDPSKNFGMPLGDWPKQPLNKQGKRFPSPLASPNLLSSQAPELWSPQQAPGLGFQKGWQSGQDEIFRFPSSPLSTPTSKQSFDSWPNSSGLITEDQNVFSPPTSSAMCSDDGNFFPLSMPNRRKPEGNFGRFSQSHGSSNGKAFVCYNCGINFHDKDEHTSHVESCGL